MHKTTRSSNFNKAYDKNKQTKGSTNKNNQKTTKANEPNTSKNKVRHKNSNTKKFSFSMNSRWHRIARLRPVSQQSPQGFPRNRASICLVEHRSFSTFEGGMSAASFLHSSFLQAVNAVMLWLVHVEKVPQASEHLCPAKLQTRCDICCACQSICPFIPTDTGVPWTVDPQESIYPKTVHGCVLVGAAHSRLHLL